MRHVGWKGKVTHPPSVGENLYLSEQQIQVFSCSSQTTHLLLGFNEIEVPLWIYGMGWDGLLLLNILHNNQLKELGDISNNAVVNLPVYVLQGLISLKEVN